MSDLTEIRKLQLEKHTDFFGTDPKGTLEDAYQFELDKFSFEKWEMPKRAARLSAAVKTYKSSQMLRFLLLALPDEFQMSPRIAKRMCLALFKRQGSTTALNLIFGGHIEPMSGRVDKEIWEQIDDMVDLHKKDAKKAMKSALAEIEVIKDDYQRRIRVKNKEADKLIKQEN